MTPAIPLLSMYLKKIKSVSQRDTCTHMFTSSLFTIAKIWQQPMVLSVDEGIEKVCVCTNSNGMLFSHSKKEKILLFTTAWMNLEDTMVNEVWHTKTNTTNTHIYEQSKKLKFMQAESRTVVTKVRKVGKTDMFIRWHEVSVTWDEQVLKS